MNEPSSRLTRMLSQVNFMHILAVTVFFVAAQSFFLIYNFVENINSIQAQELSERIQTEIVRKEISEIKPLVEVISEKRTKIDPLLPTVNTNELDLLEERLFYDVSR